VPSASPNNSPSPSDLKTTPSFDILANSRRRSQSNRQSPPRTSRYARLSPKRKSPVRQSLIKASPFRASPIRVIRTSPAKRPTESKASPAKSSNGSSGKNNGDGKSNGSDKNSGNGQSNGSSQTNKDNKSSDSSKNSGNGQSNGNGQTNGDSKSGGNNNQNSSNGQNNRSSPSSKGQGSGSGSSKNNNGKGNGSGSSGQKSQKDTLDRTANDELVSMTDSSIVAPADSSSTAYYALLVLIPMAGALAGITWWRMGRTTSTDLPIFEGSAPDQLAVGIDCVASAPTPAPITVLV